MTTAPGWAFMLTVFGGGSYCCQHSPAETSSDKFLRKWLLTVEHLLLAYSLCCQVSDRDHSPAEQRSSAARGGEPLLTCSFSMAVFKASWTSTGTVSTVEPGKDVCNLQLLRGQDTLTNPLDGSQRG